MCVVVTQPEIRPLVVIGMGVWGGGGGGWEGFMYLVWYVSFLLSKALGN